MSKVNSSLKGSVKGRPVKESLDKKRLIVGTGQVPDLGQWLE